MADWQLIEEGLKRGYSLDEVTDIIAKEEGVDPSYARERGFDSPAILVRLGYVKPEAPKAEGSGLLRRAGDYGLSAIKSAIAVPEIAVGLADIATGGQAGKAAESVGFKPKEAKEILDSYLTPEQQAANKAVHEAEGFMPTIKAAIEHPSTIAHSVVESAGPMLAGGVAGRGLLAVAPKIAGGATTAAAIGEGVAGAGSAAEQIRQQSSNGELSANQSGMALASGVGTAAFGFVGGRLAQKLGINDVDTMLVKAGSQYTSKGVVRRIVEGGISEGVFEELPQSTQEQIWQNAALDRPLMDGVENSAAMGMLAGVAMGGAGGFVPSGANPRPPANVTPPPSIASASSTDDAIKAFKVEVETASPAPRGSFGVMDEFARLIEDERSDLGKRRGLLAQQQQDARDMEAEFSELVKDEQIDQSYWLNDARRQRDAERTREGDFALAEQQREEQQGRTVDQLTAASEAQGFGAEEPTAMQLAMQRAQQKALDNEFSGLLKQERASLNEMRANVKRVAGVPVEQISTPQLEENAQSDAQPNAKMEAIPALNDRHDAIQQERERLMQLRETRLEKQSNQPEQGAQHGAESHGTDGQVATPSVAGGGANVSGGGLDAAMVDANGGMRGTASAGAAVSSGGQAGAVPVADQPTNVRALTENGKPSASWVIRNKETGESLFETFDRKKVDALNTEKYEAVPILEYLQSLNKPRAESPNDAQIVNVRQHTTRRKPASNTIAQAIINLGGISTSLKTDILGDASIKTRPGLFTTNGTGDLGEIAAMLSSEFGFSQIDLNDPTDNSGAKQLADLIASSVNGETIHNEEGMILAQQAEEEAMHREDINNKAREFGIKPSGRGRPFSKVEAEVLKLVEMRLEKEIYRAGEEMQAAREFALKYFTQEEVDAICDKAVDQLGSDASILEIYQGITKAIYEAINENKGRNRDRAANSEAEGIDRESRRSGLPEAEDRRPAGEGEGAAREGQGAEVAPEFGLVGQTEEEARIDAERRNQPEGLTKEQIDREATVPFSLDGGALAPEGAGAQGSMFTPDGRAAKDAEARKPESGTGANARANVNSKSQERGNDLPFSIAGQQAATGSTINTIAAAIRKTYGDVLDKLQAKNLITLTQTQDEAIEAAAKARAEKTGRPLAEVRNELLARVRNARGDGGIDIVDARTIDIKRSADGSIQGFYDPQSGQSFLIADGLTNDAAPGVLAHEVGIHMAADKAASKNMERLFKRAGVLVRGHAGAFFDRVRSRMKDAGETSNEEAAAYIAEEWENNRKGAPESVASYVREWIAAVKAWLAGKGVSVDLLNLGPADIAAIARANVRTMAGENGYASAHQARNIVRELGAPYETDIFGSPLPTGRVSRGRKTSANTKPASGGLSWDIQPTATLSDTEAPTGDYFVRTIVGTEVSRKLGASVIKTPEDAAKATAYLYRSAVERFDAIVTDKDGKPLGVVGGFKGALAQAAVPLGTIVAEAVRIPGAANIWFSHNHPSGLSKLSSADVNMMRALSDAFNGSGIEPRGLLAVSNGRFSFEDAHGDILNDREIASPSASTVTVPVIEREQEATNTAQEPLNNPGKAKAAARAYHQRSGDGIILLNSQHAVAAWIPIGDVMRGTLRNTGGLNAIYRAISEANAGAAILVHDGRLDDIHPDSRAVTVGNNIAAALQKAEVRPLDIINVKTGESAAERGGAIAAGPVYSQSSPTEAEVRGLMAQYASTEGAPSEAQIRAAVRDYRDTERAYGGQAAYEKAKAAGKTKLGYRQWVQVRTQAFKQWFGDWEAVRGRDALQKMEAMNLDSTPALADQKAVEDVFRGEAGNPETVSKVIDPTTGEPMELAHGSKENFSVFNKKYGGIYLTEDAADSIAIFTESGQGDPLYLFLNAKKPFDARFRNMSNEKKTELREIISSVVDDADVEDAAERLDISLEDADPFEVFTDGEFYFGYGRALQNAVIEEIKSRGYDGVIFPDHLQLGSPHTSFVAFDPNQIKSATGNVGTFGESDDIRFSRAGNGTDSGVAMFSRADGNQPWYFSALEDGIRNAKLKTQPASQWVAWIRSQQQFKKEEVEWSGILDHLASLGKERVTSGDLAQWVAENGVRVEEVVLGEDRLADLQKQLDEINDRYNAIIDEHGVTVQELPAAAKKEIDDLTVRHDEIADRIADTYHTDYATKHASGNLVLPGGTDHREIVLTVPSVDPYNESDSTHYGDVGKGKQIAWTRVNTRTDADGNKVLFVEEIQSQRNQHGRKKGFDIPAARLPEKPATYVDIVVGDEIKGWGTVQSIRDGNDGKEFDVGGLWIGENKFTLDKVASRDSGHLNAGKNKALIPTAPFVSTKDGKPTDSYIPLTLKRLIAYAVDTGHDAIAWTTGEQQADRYDLSKQIDSITVWSNGEGAYHYDAKKDGRSLNSDSAPVTPTKLEEIIGKDLAEKAIADITAGRPAKYSGLDLKVGGGWTASMYGDASGLNAQGKPSMIAQAARKLGAEVSSIQLGRKIDPYIKNDGGVYVVIDDISGDIISPEYGYESQAQSRLEQIESERTQQPSFPITDQMREQASKGMPLFQRDKAQAGTSAYPLSKDQSAAERLNRNLADHFKDSSWENAYVQRNLPDSFNAVAEAARAAFGTRVVGITATEQRFNQFNGVNLYRTAYVNLGAKPSFVNIAGHEIYHSLEKERPDLHQWFVAQARKHFRNFDEYQAKLNALVSANEQPYTREKAESELLADFTGDALADPKFLAQLAEADGSKFRRLLNAVAGWLKLAGEKLTGKNLGSSAYFNDVNELRKFLNRALIAYSSNKPIDRILALDEPRFMTAWHGSPHDHDGFDSSKIGTGEGAQAYGWGHYFAGAREVAEWYRKTLSARGDESRDSDLVVSTLKRMRDELGVPESQLKEKLVEWFSAPAWNGMRERHPDFDAFISQHLKRGRLYQVELAPDENQYLDWDKPFDEQSPRVQSAIVNDLGVSPDFAAIDGGNTGMDIYRALAEEHGGDRAASELLLLNGVRGIRYLDGSSRPSIWKYDVDVFGSSGSLLKQHRVRTKAEADDIVADAEASGRTAKVKQIQQPDDQNHNYVIFDDADVKIIAKESRRASNDLDFTQPQGSEPLRKTSFGYANDTHNLFHVSTFKGNDGDVSTFDVYDTNTGEQLGFVSLGLRDGQITTLVAIEAEQKNVGFGEQLLRSLVARNPDGIYIINMLPEAVPFWQKMGVSLDEHFEGVWEHGNGVLTEEAIQEARDGKRGLAAEDPGGRQKESRGNAESESGRQANNPVSSKGVTNETTPANAGVSVSAPSESVRRIQAVVERFKSQFKGASALDIRVVSTTFDIPARFRPSPFAEGVFHDDAGLVYLVTMNLRDQHGNLNERRAWQILLHETIGHFGLSRMMGDKFAGILKAVKQATSTKGRVTDETRDTFQPGDKDYATWDAVKLRYPDATDAEIAQEVLARMAETDPGSSVLGYAIAVVRQWVRDVARAMGINLAVSTSELRDLVAKASGYMRRGDNLAEEHEPSGLVAASTGVAREGGKRGLESRAATVQPQGPIWSAPEMSRTDNIIYTMQDKNIDLKRVQQAIKEAVGEIRDDIDTYLQEELFHGRAAKITEEFLDKEVNPLISLMRASKVSMDELETFLWARHAKERNAQIAKINDEMPDGGSGLTNKQADDLMAGKDVKIGDKTIAGVKPARKKLLSDLAGRVDAITKGNRALLERYSLESADTLNAWDGAYKHYVPLHREDAESHLAGMGTGQGYSVKGSSSKRATGSSRPVENILANLALQRERIITRGEKNRVAQSLYGLAKEMPNADLWEVDVKPTMRTTAMIGGREQVVDAIDPAFRSKPNVVFARFNGEDRFVVFNEHNERALRMAEALKNLDADDISHLLGEVSRWTRYFASINTQYNPIFGVTNLVRDVQTGLLNLKSTPIEGKQKELMGNLTHALPAVFKALRADRKGQSASGSWAQLWEEFQEVGGQTGYRDMFRNSHERAEALQNALDPTWWQKTWWGKAATVGGVLAVPEQFLLDAKYGGKWVFNLLSDYNTMMENGIRLSAYKVALDSGMTKERAASLAKNLTVNFNRKGQAARQVGALYAFFNASVQGTARMAETLNHGAKPGELLGKAGKQIVYGGLLLGAVQAMLLMAAGFDDEEPPEFVRDRNIIIPTGNGKYVSIPMPLGFHVLPAISRISIEFTAGGFKKPGEHLVHIMDVLLDSFNPIGNAGLSMQTVAPTVLDPIAALTENKDWSGRQIARQDFSKLNPTPGHTRAKDTASSLSRGLAYALNYLSGGGEYGIGIVSPTPDQIDYLLGQLTGGVGRELGKVLTTGEAMATGEDLPPHKIPLVGRFYGDTTGQSSEASKFYARLEKLAEHKGALDRMKDEHDLEAYREYVKEHPESRLYARAARVQRELASLRKLKRKMIERNADRAKVRQIEDRMRTLMTRFNQSVSEQKGDH